MRNVEEIIANAEDTSFTVDGFIVANFKLDTSHRRLFLGKDDALKIEILVRSSEVLYFEALDLNLFNQSLVECIKCIKDVHKVMLCLVCSGVVNGKQRIKVLERVLCDLSTHLLRFVHDDNRTVSSNNIDGLTRAEIITLGEDNTSFLGLSIFF